MPSEALAEALNQLPLTGRAWRLHGICGKRIGMELHAVSPSVRHAR